MKRRFSAVTVMFVALGLTAGFAPAAQATNDPRWGEQYGVRQIQAHAAWTKTKGDGVIIAVVDSGVDVDHPDLKGKLVPGRDFGDGDNDPDDDSRLKDGSGKVVQGHGTHVAGIAAAITENGEGIAGTAPNAKILPMKIFASKEGGTLATGLTSIPDAINESVNRGAKVINLSIGGIQGASLVGLIETPCRLAYDRGSLCVVAAGNSGKGKPSGYDKDVWFLNVTANDENRNRAGFGQNADTKWAVSAPGVAIMSTYPIEIGRYTMNQGTSMAAPFAAGAAALLFGQGKNVQQVIERLRTTATPTNDSGMGSGIINVGAAVGAPPITDGAAGGGTTATTKKGSSSSGGGTSPTRPSGSGGGGLPTPGGSTDSGGGSGLPGEATDDGSFDQFNESGESGGTADTEQASSEKDKAAGIDSTTMLGILAGFLLLGVLVPVVQAWGRRGRARA